MDRPATGTHPLPGTRCLNLVLLVAVVGDRRATVICDGRGTGLSVRVRRSEPVTDVLPSTPGDRRHGSCRPVGAPVSDATRFAAGFPFLPDRPVPLLETGSVWR